MNSSEPLRRQGTAFLKRVSKPYYFCKARSLSLCLIPLPSLPSLPSSRSLPLSLPSLLLLSLSLSVWLSWAACTHAATSWSLEAETPLMESCAGT